MRSVDAKTREALREIAQAWVEGFGQSPFRREILKTVLAEDLTDLLPAWAKQAAGSVESRESAVTRALTLLTLDAYERLNALARECGPLFRELSALGRCDLIQVLANALIDYVADRSPSRRLLACEALLELLPAFEREVPEEAFAEVEERLRPALESESDEKAYSKESLLAATLADFRIRRRSFARALGMLEVLHGHYLVKRGDFPQRSPLAFHALERVVAGNGFPSLLEQFRAGSPDASLIVERLDVAATRYLISEIESAEDGAWRLRLAEYVLRGGSSAAAMMQEEAQRASDPAVAMRLAEVLPYALPEGMAEVALGGLLRHPSHTVRRRAALILAERGYPHAGGLAADALPLEKDPATRAGLIETLGKVHHAGAVDSLCRIAESRSEPEHVRAAACQSLGRIRDSRAVSSLCRIYTRGAPGWRRWIWPVPAGVRVAALRALGRFAGEPGVRELMRRTTKDPDPILRSAATEALYAPIHQAFGDLAREVTMISAVQDVRAENLKLAGSLGEIPFDQICQLIGSTEKTGVLLLDFEGPVGRIYFDAGAVVAAEYEGREDLAAFHAMFRRKNGCFVFRPGEQAPSRRLNSPVTSLLLESCRAWDETARS